MCVSVAVGCMRCAGPGSLTVIGKPNLFLSFEIFKLFDREFTGKVRPCFRCTCYAMGAQRVFCCRPPPTRRLTDSGCVVLLETQIALIDMFAAMVLYINEDIKKRLELGFTLFDDDGNGTLDRVCVAQWCCLDCSDRGDRVYVNVVGCPYGCVLWSSRRLVS